jgi:hypothetical protein
MVHELHKQGWQRLRIHSGMSPSGCHWRCAIFPSSLTEEERDQFEDPSPFTLVARYTSADEKEFFGWKDSAKDDARQLAVKFIQRFPRIVEMGRGRDWNYTGWYSEILGHAEHGRFPISYWDAMTTEEGERMRQSTWLDLGETPFPLPPPPTPEENIP